MSGAMAQANGKAARLGRSDRSAIGRWFWEIDKVLLLLVAVLISIGLIAVAAASPAAGVRYSGAGVSFPPLYYFYRQLVWILVSLPVLIGVSMLPKPTARRLSLIGALIFTFCLFLVPILGHEVNGARRWIWLGFTQFQPSEFLKPLFIVSIAWLLSLKEKDQSLPIVPLTAACTGIVAVLLMMQPNFGETIIFVSAWVLLLLLSGAPMRFLLILGATGLVAVVAAYFLYPVATQRIDGFLFSEGDNYQVVSALRTLTAGGLFGVGPGAGTRKFSLPEPHTDYIFSVIGEEFGIIACLAIAILYMTIVARVLIRLLNEEDKFIVLATAGLVCQFGMQALINMAVNVHIAPSKGMTLPFISYGGSSMIALAIGFGLLLAFSRRNPYLDRSPYVVKWSGLK
ncbi:FtsW/RodA/SpoVE family cell cycle protein [Sphingosinicella ginsenosidimutans]|uniref:Probable peptidoglycan glycosyltransferase FtsW n=1 Tax=Allosphingosinicella ginsenosidimutans TaxID=1176539 RepID=A0A5C6TQT1_9SPHN|nr:putative peptidoglycan glycosyltransferase FtsW [Sphingosinicella ginsenosidimutans]TXC62703.1 cell division protein FtsW [Sphingosinicella ginsenosidimutans]